MYSALDNDSMPIKLYGITQDPETLNYMVVLSYMKVGSLRSNLMIKKYNPNDKYENFYYVIKSLLILHQCNLVHGDFHSGNLLLSSQARMYISDLGLSKPTDKSSKTNEIFGVLPYIAPEVLLGKPYTKAADIYSFGIIMWEMTSGIPAFNNIPHDFDLSLNICQGLRPDIIEGTVPAYVEVMKKCWDSDPNERPTAEKLLKYFEKWQDEYLYNYGHKRIPVPGKYILIVYFD